MAFNWKGHKDIWKGEGIYHLTFVVAGRKRLLGELVALGGCMYGADVVCPVDRGAVLGGDDGEDVARPLYTDGLAYEGWREECCTSRMATVRLSEFGRAISFDLKRLPARYTEDGESEKAIVICAKQFMPDHLHVVVWVKKDVGKSIRQIAQGFRIGMRKIAVERGVWGEDEGHPFEVPYIRTLSRAGQLRAMIDYVHANPDKAWMKRLHPDLFTMHKDTEARGLRFRSMGNHWLLDWPERQVVACSRSIGEDDLEALKRRVMARAEMGAVTYTAAISKGEQMIARSVREAGYPLVVLMLDGFPAAGSSSEKYYKPGGVYFEACQAGKLLLMEAYEGNYENQEVIARTEAELKRKAEAKHWGYVALPHESKRWRMIAGNIMLGMIGGEEGDGA